MSTAPLEIDGVVRASQIEADRRPADHPRSWGRALFAGRLAEVAGSGASASLTWTLALIRQTQADGEPAAWVTTEESAFFPPDVQNNGVDLAALPVVRVPDRKAAGRAADKLVRSGGFGLVVVDLVAAADSSEALPRPLQKRLLKHADRHEMGVVFVTDKSPEAPSIGSFVSLRLQTERTRHGANQFACRVEGVADNRGGPGWSDEEVFGGPPGLR